MGNFISSLNRSSSISHTRLIGESVVDLENMEDDTNQQQMESISKVQNIYNWISANKTFCAVVGTGTCLITMGACIIGYLNYIDNEIKANEEGVAKITEELMCALNTFVKDVYNSVPNITETAMWRDLTSKTDAIMESYPQELADKIKGIIEGCKTLYEANVTASNTTSSVGL